MTTERRQPADVKLVRLGYTEASINYFVSMALHPDSRGAFPDDGLTGWSLHKTAEAIRDNEVLAYAPVVDGAFAGLIWARYMSPDIVTGTWCVMKQFRHASTKIVSMMCDEVFKTLKPRSIMVFVAKYNRASFAGCWRAGFRPQGELPKHILIGGTWHDAHIMVLNSLEAAQ